MLKGNFIKKSFSIKNHFLDKSLLGPLESQSHLLEVGGLLGTGTGLPQRGLAVGPGPQPEGVLRAEVGLGLQCR